MGQVYRCYKWSATNNCLFIYGWLTTMNKAKCTSILEFKLFMQENGNFLVPLTEISLNYVAGQVV